MNYCPCCSSKLLCHINQQKTYWFCSNCGQEMPNLNDLNKTKTKADHTNLSVLSTKN
ncbi:hypothetical protein Sta7437_2494 [Stanieria cyanosphaera PCC 7437]|uniref:Uncharacterized protein n=1 Tax=Stanieria cyanosphaera (strain ATCC 29371 / PCC 7437) TaxID=111780 RepID=K9XWI3_STAC7|nr:hypothetical protein Sta7437_2494 [Stanieria cyanosphaera PCC 7437]